MNTTRDVKIGAAVLAVLGVLLVWYLATHPAPAHAPITTSTTATSTALDEHGQFYDVTASYPAQTPLKAMSAAADAAAVETMKQWEVGAIAQFKSDSGIDTLTPKDVQTMGLGTDRKYALDIEYDATTSPVTVSYIFKIYADTLGAHPNAYYKTFTFDHSGANLAIQDLFVSNAPYLDRLSTISRADLTQSIAAAEQVTPADIDTQMLNSGTTPTTENFQFFVLNGTSLTIIFPPYQVGPWVLGTQQDDIPLAKLADILKPAFKP